MPIMAITAPTPMMIPSMVRKARVLLRVMANSASLRNSSRAMVHPRLRRPGCPSGGRGPDRPLHLDAGQDLQPLGDPFPAHLRELAIGDAGLYTGPWACRPPAPRCGPPAWPRRRPWSRCRSGTSPGARAAELMGWPSLGPSAFFSSFMKAAGLKRRAELGTRKHRGPLLGDDGDIGRHARAEGQAAREPGPGDHAGASGNPRQVLGTQVGGQVQHRNGL